MITLSYLLTFDLSLIDKGAAIIAIVGYMIVFFALVLLFFVFTSLPKIMNVNYRKIFRRKQEHGLEEVVEQPSDLSGEVNAALAMAIYLHFYTVHDEESNVVTIKRISRAYSPWSSKIYAVRNQFNRI